ncbi:DUF2238 domain-containing protein [Paenibacillus sacheonensis]|uniref:DUF2238 domain-containing protein n=1 Tax=Paenibacillus sacheonensis TaxID=742054 RepID=A0A7X4YQ49_9BACL|nr:DUF2238 domain-containing protein [Paenibacillus sacheonensis]MBM7566290.1 putative membrane protein [Paenibacillus sacheonensis]NBC70496.1 DUF2238 domain-containing protein [Paenibacillus sacheonensis]
MFSSTRTYIVPVTMLLVFIGFTVWSVIRPRDYAIWFAEVTPALVTVIILCATFRTFRFTDLFYGLLAASLILVLIGGHYTYESVPAFNELKRWFHWKRNHFDRLGHGFQGIIPAFAARELLLRLHLMKPGKWPIAIAIACTLAVSSLYEIAEFAAYECVGGNADEFLGMQGDRWDAQWDMISALSGAIIGLVCVGRLHARKIHERMSSE